MSALCKYILLIFKHIPFLNESYLKIGDVGIGDLTKSWKPPIIAQSYAQPQLSQSS